MCSYSLNRCLCENIYNISSLLEMINWLLIRILNHERHIRRDWIHFGKIKVLHDLGQLISDCRCPI